MSRCSLPPKSEIKKAIIELLTAREKSFTSEINQYIIDRFNIDQETYSEKNEYENTTIFAYRMCWIRTELRNEGIICSPAKCVWEICKKK